MPLAGTAAVIAASATVALAVLALAGVATVALTVRAARRRYRRWRAIDRRIRRQHLVERGVTAIACSPMSQPGWWRAQGERHRLWRSITAAERAVAAAVAAKVPVGDLPQLCRRLRLRADAVDASLAAAGGAATIAARAQVNELVRLANEVRRAAGEALLSGAAEPASGGLAEAIAVEVAALRHGLATLSPGRSR